jgi:CRP-like cAMP-binding protein
MATGTANLIGLMALIYRRSPWAVPKMYRDVYPRFKMLPPGDFRKLVKVAERSTRPAGYPLTVGGQPVSTLYYIIDGAVRLEKFGESFDIPDAVFVGEVAYLTNRRASASTVLTKESDVLEWDVDLLKQRSKRDPRFRLAIDAVISLDLAGKVARAGSPVQRRNSSVSASTDAEEHSVTTWAGP